MTSNLRTRAEKVVKDLINPDCEITMRKFTEALIKFHEDEKGIMESVGVAFEKHVQSSFKEKTQLRAEITKLKESNKALREALRYYANGENLEFNTFISRHVQKQNQGNVAKQALSEK